ncbi:MAG: cobalamin biosynthesis protein CobD [Methanoculleus sp. SDB]|nr:MAG: cobalamin biosynthesis protein CobD [Methanoculleus sp. SDB]
MVFPALVLWAALFLDRLAGDPRNTLHPTAYLGRLIGWWGRPGLYRPGLQRVAGVLGTLLTAGLFAAPFLFFDLFAPVPLYLIGAPVLLKLCLAWRCLEEHVAAVEEAVARDGKSGRDEVRLLVSRDTSALGGEGVLSAAYESMAENCVDSIIAPLFYFTLFGLPGAAVYRAVNTMDAMLGYTDHRRSIGWFPARSDDILNYIPARITGLLLLLYFAMRGRFRPALRTLASDAHRRPGINGGIPMAAIAGGAGVRFEKPRYYTMGEAERSLTEGGPEIVGAVRAATLCAAVLFSVTLVFIALPAL